MKPSLKFNSLIYIVILLAGVALLVSILPALQKPAEIRLIPSIVVFVLALVARLTAPEQKPL